MRKFGFPQPALPSFPPSCRIRSRLYPGPPALLDSTGSGSGGGWEWGWKRLEKEDQPEFQPSILARGQASHPGAKGRFGALQDSAPLSHGLPEPRHPRAQILDCKAFGQPRSEGAQLGAQQSGRWGGLRPPCWSRPCFLKEWLMASSLASKPLSQQALSFQRLNPTRASAEWDLGASLVSH